jgi:ThiF family protein
MGPFPEAPEEFYRLRDDRTNRVDVAPTYATRSVSITADKGILSTEAGQVLFLSSCNLLSRWCRRVFICIDDVPCILGDGISGPSLVSTAIGQMTDADPFGAFRQSGDDPDLADLRLHVGVECGHSRIRTTLVSSVGWYAIVGRPGTILSRGNNPKGRIGALFAAGFGAAQVFRDAVSPVSKPLERKVILFDALRMKFSLEIEHDNPYSAPADLGQLLMIGAGAVGGAAVYCLTMQNSTASLTVVDGDIAKVENFNRSPILGRSQYGLPKAEVVANFLRGSRIASTAIPSWFDELELARLDSLERYDVWLPLANERNVRWLIQNQVPPLMVQASTSRSWGFNFGRHIPGLGDCLADRFSGLDGSESMRCAEGPVPDQAAGSVDAALPFLSFLGGASIAADLERLNMRDYPHCPNFGAYDLRDEIPGSQLFDRRARMQCICRTQEVVFRRYRASGKYAHLSKAGWSAS